MSTNTVFNLSDRNCRMFAIDAIASPHQAMLRSSAYTVKVQYSSLATTIQSICQHGGKILNVRSLSMLMPTIQAAAEIAPIQAQILPLPEVMEIAAVVEDNTLVVEQISALPQTTKKVEPSQPNSRRHSKSKKR